MARLATFFVRLCALVVLGMAGPSVRAAGESGTFGVISDIHFNPFAATKDQPMSRIGHDTNHALLGLGPCGFRARHGERGLRHRAGRSIGARVQRQGCCGARRRSGLACRGRHDCEDDALRRRCARQCAGRQAAFVAVGNEEFQLRRLQIEPGGSYLAATREAVRRLVGAERLEPDFAETWAAAGDDAARHPTVANGLIVVLNDVMWSRLYQDACGSHGLAAAQAMMSWLSERLARQRAAGGRVWLVHQIPWGIDADETINAKGPSCAAKVIPFLKEPFASELRRCWWSTAT